MRLQQIGTAFNCEIVDPDQAQGGAAIGIGHRRSVSGGLDLAGRFLAMIAITNRAQERRSPNRAFNRATLAFQDDLCSHSPPTKLNIAPCGSIP